jgi:FkbM family methyltransferase
LNCLAIEPYAANFLTLHEACRLNGFRNVRLVAAAAGEAPGTIAMENAGAYARFSVDGLGPQSIVLRAEHILEQEGFLDADILKIDIEGAELFAFRGLEHFFDANSKVRVIFESNSDACRRLGYDYRDCMRFFEARGFTLYLVRQERFYKTSSADIQPWAVADIIATRSPLPEIPPFEHAELAPTQIMNALIDGASAPEGFIRNHVRAEAKLAGRSLTEHPRWGDVQAAIST